MLDLEYSSGFFTKAKTNRDRMFIRVSQTQRCTRRAIRKNHHTSRYFTFKPNFPRVCLRKEAARQYHGTVLDKSIQHPRSHGSLANQSSEISPRDCIVSPSIMAAPWCKNDKWRKSTEAARIVRLARARTAINIYYNGGSERSGV